MFPMYMALVVSSYILCCIWVEKRVPCSYAQCWQSHPETDCYNWSVVTTTLQPFSIDSANWQCCSKNWLKWLRCVCRDTFRSSLFHWILLIFHEAQFPGIADIPLFSGFLRNLVARSLAHIVCITSFDLIHHLQNSNTPNMVWNSGWNNFTVYWCILMGSLYLGWKYKMHQVIKHNLLCFNWIVLPLSYM